ncbi:hypothetical protein IV498_15955 [Paenarthrobacter sp. Z7-10]|uniref:hypothetical protein n=1 Tax=Paenarthrobacter sp. Z7-10 TaxID=2787635 RepID=UPI0022A9F57B|nr:hypothetical protein [Paenarthrobacter sp. Z7-10]MCZ2404631.1 hypothetical protein [Paenarthrobacter sp. Z7-10]
MPTTRRRHVITESDEVAAALRDAAQRWPGDADRPGRLVAHLLNEGHRAILADAERAAAARREAVTAAAGRLSGIYEEGYLAGLRDEWPE